MNNPPAPGAESSYYLHLVQEDAEQYGVSSARMWATITCEDPSLDPNKQSDVLNSKGPNGRENSWGLTQIDLDYNPGITKEEAEDPVFSIDLMARSFSAGNPGKYHCYKILFGTP